MIWGTEFQNVLTASPNTFPYDTLNVSWMRFSLMGYSLIEILDAIQKVTSFRNTYFFKGRQSCNLNSPSLICQYPHLSMCTRIRGDTLR